MVLDESTSMLDPGGRADVMRVVNELNKKEGMAVVMITHFMEEAVTADRIIVMNEGRVYMQGGKEIFKRQDELESIGLTVPLASRVANRLRAKGVAIDEDVTTYEELVNKICPLE
jgi:energy-coupling factor transport system ATP-binding protein